MNVIGIILLCIAGLAFLPILLFGLMAIGDIFYQSWKESRAATIGCFVFVGSFIGGLFLVMA